MKTVRSNCFETNSSSTHSITIDTSYTSQDEVNRAMVHVDSFGWEYERFNSFLQKASYFWTLACNEYLPLEQRELKDRMIRLSERYGFVLVEPEGENYYYGVDHGREHYEEWVSSYPELDTDEGLMNFLRGLSGWIFLGNDNSEGPTNFRMTPNQIENAWGYVRIEGEDDFRFAIGEELTGMDLTNFIGRCAYDYIERTSGTDYSSWPQIQAVMKGKIFVVSNEYVNGKVATADEYELSYELQHNE